MLRSVARLSGASAPLSRGFLAGLHADQPEYAGFAEAYATISQVPDDLLLEFERELREDQGRTFVFGSERVSVLDTTTAAGDGAGPTTLRALILNARPHLVQTCVALPGPAGAPFVPSGAPPPLAGTHLGGLALALLPAPAAPRCVVVGAGGCTLPHVLARHAPGGAVVALEPCAEVCAAARAWFGATGACGFDLRPAPGAAYLRARAPGSVDVLLVDADDGAVPPAEMRTAAFWRDVVGPVLAGRGTAGVNVIGEREEQEALQDAMAEALPRHCITRVAAPAEADVDASRHALLFATPGALDPDALERELIGRPVVSDPQAWLREVRKAD